MKLFISWSGKQSRLVAEELYDWLPKVIQSLEPWISNNDIEAGARWNNDISKALSDSDLGLICLTKDNLESPWLLFEAGALAKSLDDSLVCPYLIDIEPSDIPAGPLAQFQAKRAIKNETEDIVKTINNTLSNEKQLKEKSLCEAFEKWWPDLEKNLKNLSENEPNEPLRTSEEMISEVLNIVRSIKRNQYKNIKMDLDDDFIEQLVEIYFSTQNKKFLSPSEIRNKKFFDRNIKQNKNNGD
ncbi:MAG: toll/interleukin-1 receptor domain-containing protein [Bacillota bacterium]